MNEWKYEWGALSSLDACWWHIYVDHVSHVKLQLLSSNLYIYVR